MNIVVTCEIDKTLVVATFVAYSAGVWKYDDYILEQNKPYTFWVDGFGGNLDDLSTNKKKISSMIVGTTILASMVSEADLLDTFENCFYYDYDSQRLLVKFINQSPWYINKAIRLGQTTVYTTKAQNYNNRPVNRFINGVALQPRVLLDSISVDRVEDDLGSNEMTFNDFSFELDNADGSLDDTRAEVINLGARIKKAEVENGVTVIEDDFEVIRSGYTSNVSFPDDTTVKFTCSDPRSTFTNKVNSEKITVEEYPNIADTYIGKYVPLVLGEVTKVPALRLQADSLEADDDDSSWSEEIDFLVSSTKYGYLTELQNVYLEGSIYIRDIDEGEWVKETFTKDTALDPSYYNSSLFLSKGQISIPRLASGNIYVSCQGYLPNGSKLIHNILFWLLDKFAGRGYLSSFFNLDETDAVRARASTYTGGVYFDKSGTDLTEAIDILASSFNTRLVEQKEIFTLRDLYVDDEVYDIKNHLLLSTPERYYDTDRYMSSISVGYGKDYSEDEYITSQLTDYEEDAINNNSLDVVYEFDTALNEKTSADEVALERYIISPPLHLNIEMNTKLEFKLYDFVTYELQRRNGKVLEANSKYKVIAINELKRTATLRWIEYV